MPRAALANSISASEIPPIECVNRTLDPYGEGVQFHADRIFSPDQRRDLTSVFVAKQLIADEVERLLAILDALDGDADLELTLGAHRGNADPRLDDAECDLAESEPSLGAGAADAEESQDGWSQVDQHIWQDREDDPAEPGVADLDGLIEQIGRAA
jgi:hypothetical protein